MASKKKRKKIRMAHNPLHRLEGKKFICDNGNLKGSLIRLVRRSKKGMWHIMVGEGGTRESGGLDGHNFYLYDVFFYYKRITEEELSSSVNEIKEEITK